MASDYCTKPQVKALLPDSGITGDYDALFDSLITRASRLLDIYTKREPGAYSVPSTDEETRYFNGSGRAVQWLDEFVTTPSLVAVSESGGLSSSDYTTYSSSDWFVFPENAAQMGQPYQGIELDILNGSKSVFYRFRKSVKVTAAWGYALSTAATEIVTQASAMQVARWFGRARQGWADTGAIPELAQLTYTKSLDPEVAEMIVHLKRVIV